MIDESYMKLKTMVGKAHRGLKFPGSNKAPEELGPTNVRRK